MNLFSFIKNQLSIADVVLDYVTLKHIGSYWKGTCPFHSETDASFTVSPDRGIFYCFGCHASGDVIGFIAKKEQFSQIEAAWHLVEHYRLQVPAEVLGDNTQGRPETLNEKQRYHTICMQVMRWAAQQFSLFASPQDYLRTRLIEKNMIEAFSIGYFPGGLRAMNSFVQEMARVQVLLKDLIDTGIVIQNGAILYSPFEERIIFPIKDALGRCCGFGGRIYKPNDERAKYYNSKESTYFQKGQLLFGLDQAKKKLQESGYAFLVEGYTDCIAMSQAGYGQTVATLGTACTKDHLQLVARYVHTLYVLYDGDKAGQQAILRLAPLCFDVNLDLKIMKLPAAEDPASFLAHGNDIEALRNRAVDIFTFFVEMQGVSFMNRPLADKLLVTERIVGLLALIADSFKQDLLLQHACSVLNVPFASLKEQCLKAKEAKIRPVNQAPAHQDPLAVGEATAEVAEMNILEKKIIYSILNLNDETSSLAIDDDLLPYFSKRARDLIEKCRSLGVAFITDEHFKKLYGEVSGEDQQWLGTIGIKDHQPVTHETARHYLSLFRRQVWKAQMQDIKQQMLSASQRGDSEALTQLNENFIKLKHTMKDRGLI